MHSYGGAGTSVFSGNNSSLKSCILTLRILGKIFSRNIFSFVFFSRNTGFDISCKLSPLETICMKCQILVSGRIIRKISPICHLLN